MNDRPLTGRTALVTGGAKGTGRACCLRLAQAGADVAINYLTSEEEAGETAELVRQIGGRSLWLWRGPFQPGVFPRPGLFAFGGATTLLTARSDSDASTRHASMDYPCSEGREVNFRQRRLP